MRSETIAIHGGFDVDPTTQRGRGADLPDRGLRLRQRRSRRGAVQPRSRGLPLQPHQQSDHRRAGTARRRAGRRRRRARRRVGPGGAALRGAQPRRDRRQHRLGAAALRHHPHAVRACAAAARASRARFAADDQRRRDRAPDRRRHPRGVLRERRQPGRQHLRHRGAGRASRTATACR